MKFTEEQCDNFLSCLNEARIVIGNGMNYTFLEIMAKWIADNLEPEEVFSEDKLTQPCFCRAANK